MNYDIFQEVKQRTEIVSVAKYYGIVFKSKKAFCPFHHDKKTPNLSFKNGRYKCFSCNAGGDVIDFVSNLFSISNMEAISKLNEDFHLMIDLKKTMKAPFIDKLKKENAIYEAWVNWEKTAFKTLINEYQHNEKIINQFAPHTIDEEWNTQFIEALEQRHQLDYLLSVLTNGNFDDRLVLFKEYRERITKLGYKN